jgi:hypothetical protein
MLVKRTLIHLIVIMALSFGERVANAQPPNAGSPTKKDTVSVFGNRLKVALPDGAFEKMPADVSDRKYAELFSLHDVTSSRGFVLRGKDTLVFYMTSIDRPTENDGGILTWQVINSFLDKASAYRMESGWSRLGRDYLYYVKLILDEKPDNFFEFNFFFIENKLAFSLLERQIKERFMIEQEGFTLISPK